MKHNKHIQKNTVKRAVIKIGSGVLTKDDGLNLKAIKSISRQICQLIDTGMEIILVTSGAMASGVKKIGLSSRPDDIPKRQAVAAVGQAGLMMEYEKAFGRFRKNVAQILLTSDDFSNRKRYLNARNTIYTLLSWGIVPIVNENDTVAVEEIEVGDNDNLAAMITLLMDADLLINLSDIEGLYTKDPRTSTDAELIPTVSVINKHHEKIAGSIPGPLGTGGMLSKIKAAKKVTTAGIPMLIAKGESANVLLNFFAGKGKGTFFTPVKEKLASRKCWLAFSSKPKGAVIIDKGAASAILTKGKSLLPIGIVDVKDDFHVGTAVEVRDTKNKTLGIGLVNYSAADILKIKGLNSSQIKKQLSYQSYDEVIHRDNLVITTEK
ncbi:MAG: glutamate 5-kinase [Deltaproteobacteria bacterium]|nr:glutamate 5-kinase [Deltaproteobacteria bacterium]MBW2364091.1 glutamate 5-kinase [Deltaproteobacteria bacterium]